MKTKNKINKLEYFGNTNYVPVPTYTFNVGDKVSMGNLENVVIDDVREAGKLYVIDYSITDNNYGNPITTHHNKMLVAWMDIRPIPTIKTSIVKNSDLRFNYSQRSISDLFGKVYHFGIDFDVFYQREYVWTLENKVSLIDSIFNMVDIGKFTYIKRPYKHNDYTYEILDGKQRIRTIMDYYENRFNYNGIYYNDLSKQDRHYFRDYSISIAELSENMTDEMKLRMFIMLNTAGKIMEKSHIDKVRQLLDNIEGK